MGIRRDEVMIVNGRLSQVGLSFRGAGKGWARFAVFSCECGGRSILAVGHVRSGHAKSCGCIAPRTNPVARITKGRLAQLGMPFKVRKGKNKSVLHAVFQCSCGNKTIATMSHVKSGHTTSCGCFHLEQLSEHATWHGHTKGKAQTPEYKTWLSMHSRCKAKPGSHHWKYYGAKGITVCERWNTFQKFFDDMGKREDGHTIDRVDGTKGYSQENCRWATKAVQCLNVSDIRMITHDGKTLCIKDWAREIGMGYLTLWNRINAGWSVEKALTTPVRKMNQ